MKMLNRVLDLLGSEYTVSSGGTRVRVLERGLIANGTSNKYVTRATGNTVPVDGEVGYARGCIFVQLDGDSARTFFINEGDHLLCDFNAVPSITSSAVTKVQAAPTAATVSATLTAAQLLGGLITVNQAAGGVSTLTLPTGALLDAALPAAFGVDNSFDFSVVNISTVAAEDCVIAGGVGTTLVGNGDIASNAAAADKSAGTFRVRKTAADAFSVYRIG